MFRVDITSCSQRESPFYGRGCSCQDKPDFKSGFLFGFLTPSTCFPCLEFQEARHIQTAATLNHEVGTRSAARSLALRLPLFWVGVKGNERSPPFFFFWGGDRILSCVFKREQKGQPLWSAENDKPMCVFCFYWFKRESFIGNVRGSLGFYHFYPWFASGCPFPSSKELPGSTGFVLKLLKGHP